MTDWTEGYRADINYTFGYYRELNPARVKLALLNAGYQCPEVITACELGFGQGLGTNIHAASSVVRWYGNDFNPAQAALAQEMAAVAGSGALLCDDSFEQFGARSDLPDFDFIGLHGIWSWVSAENTDFILDFIKRKLKVGGVLYISYNTLPGWAPFAPIRHLLNEHSNIIGSEGHGILSRVDNAIDFTQRMIATQPIFVRTNPMVQDRLKTLREHNRQYVAHEYFNTHWTPVYFSKIAERLQGVKLQFGAPAHLLDSVDAVNLTQEQQNFLKEIPDANFRETVRDFMVNQQFRRDYWIKGARKLTAIEQAEALRKLPFILVVPRGDVALKVVGALGEATLSEKIYNPILDFMADHKIKSLAQIEQSVAASGTSFSQLIQAIVLLSSSETISLVQDDTAISTARKQTDKLNTYLLQKARSGGEITFLASPVIGGGVHVNRFFQLFLLATISGKKQPAEWAQFAWQVIAGQGQKVVREGKTLESAEENLAELGFQAQAMADKYLPIYKALQLV